VGIPEPSSGTASSVDKYVPGTGLLLDLVAMRHACLLIIIDVHGKWTAGSAGPPASGARSNGGASSAGRDRGIGGGGKEGVLT
jgi:hypothetical protein